MCIFFHFKVGSINSIFGWKTAREETQYTSWYTDAFSCHCDKIPDIMANISKMRKSWLHEPEATSHIVSTIRKQKVDRKSGGL